MSYFSNYIYYPIGFAGPWNTIQIQLNQQAYIRLLDDLNYTKYRSGQDYRFYGGLAKNSLTSLSVPHAGNWHIVIDLGGNSGTIQSSLKVFPQNERAYA